tara:strand:+ start:172 stop:336 length:165 start_codon:yes stop_codon:yes gene_type:complete
MVLRRITPSATYLGFDGGTVLLLLTVTAMTTMVLLLLMVTAMTTMVLSAATKAV